MTKNQLSIVCASGAVLNWSTVATAFKIALKELSVFEMLLVASTASMFIFAFLLTVQGKWKEIKKISSRNIVMLAILGLINPVAYYLILFKAYSLLPAQIAQPINYIWPIMLLILLALFAHQSIPKRKYLGMFLSFFGVTVISVGGSASMGISISLPGILLAVISALLWATYWMVNNKYKSSIDASVSLFMSFFFGVIYLLLGALFVPVNIDSFSGVLSGIYVGAFEMGVPFILFAIAMRNTTNHTLIDQMCYLAPFLSLFFISMVLGEEIVYTTYIGLTFIVGGLLFNKYIVK